jgi:hypothetical protein
MHGSPVADARRSGASFCGRPRCSDRCRIRISAEAVGGLWIRRSQLCRVEHASLGWIKPRRDLRVLDGVVALGVEPEG